MERGIAEGVTQFLVLCGVGILALLVVLTVGVLLGGLSGRVRALDERVQALEEEVKRLQSR